MDTRIARGDAAERPKQLAWDLTIVVVFVIGFIFANVGVVRALDVALDAIHR